MFVEVAIVNLLSCSNSKLNGNVWHNAICLVFHQCTFPSLFSLSSAHFSGGMMTKNVSSIQQQNSLSKFFVCLALAPSIQRQMGFSKYTQRLVKSKTTVKPLLFLFTHIYNTCIHDNVMVTHLNILRLNGYRTTIKIRSK